MKPITAAAEAVVEGLATLVAVTLLTLILAAGMIWLWTPSARPERGS